MKCLHRRNISKSTDPYGMAEMVEMMVMMMSPTYLLLVTLLQPKLEDTSPRSSTAYKKLLCTQDVTYLY